MEASRLRGGSAASEHDLDRSGEPHEDKGEVEPGGSQGSEQVVSGHPHPDARGENRGDRQFAFPHLGALRSCAEGADPQGIGEDELRVGRLPEKEVAQPLLSCRADEEVYATGSGRRIMRAHA